MEHALLRYSVYYRASFELKVAEELKWLLSRGTDARPIQSTTTQLTRAPTAELMISIT